MKQDDAKLIRRMTERARREAQRREGTRPDAPEAVDRFEAIARHAWLFDVLCDLQRYARDQRLDSFARDVERATDRLIDHLGGAAADAADPPHRRN